MKQPQRECNNIKNIIKHKKVRKEDDSKTSLRTLFRSYDHVHISSAFCNPLWMLLLRSILHGCDAVWLPDASGKWI